MKKRLFSLLLAGIAVLTGHAQYQFPNSTFDAGFISSYDSYTEPEGWHGYATIDASSLNSAGRAGDKLVASTAVRSGASGKCVYIKSSSILGIIANGVMTNGQIYTHDKVASNGKLNYNFSDPNNTGSTNTYGANNKFFTPFTGRPDSVKVWLKNEGSGNAKVSIFTHTAGSVMYDPTDNVEDPDIIVAHAMKSIPKNSSWIQYSIPFAYSSPAEPGLILATFSTNFNPGGGSDGDMLYIDDIEMVYVSEMLNPTYNSEPITFNASGYASIDEAYNEKVLKYTTGAGAKVTTTLSDSYLLTITIEGDNISEEPSNKHTYRIQFTGVASGNDDEPNAVVKPETALENAAIQSGVFYLKNIGTGTFLQNDNKLTSTPHKWTVAGAYTFTDDSGKSMSLTRKSSASSFSASNFYVYSNSSSATTFTATEQSDGSYYLSSYIQYYDGFFSLGAKSADIYYTATSGNALTCVTSPTNNYSKWVLYEVMKYDRVTYFWPYYASASLSNGVEVKGFVKEGNAQEVKGLPLGVYAFEGEEKFYLANGENLTITAAQSNKKLIYYGRLDFSLTATYNGTAISDGSSVDEVYDSSKLSVTLAGNGQQSYKTYFDEDTYQLVVTISGYGRSRDHVIQFAAPDLSLNAKWYGEKVADGQTINEAYDESHLTVTPGMGASVATDYNAETGVLTITLSSATDSETYTLHFAVTPATVSTKNYSPLTVLKNGVSASSTGMAFSVATLENDNISFTVSGLTGLGSVTAANLPLDKNGKFRFYGELRASSTASKVPVTIYGQLVKGALVASADVKLNETSLLHATYGISTSSTASYTDNLVVTINGDATTVPNQTVTVGTLTNKNINFTLTNFKMQVNGTTSYIGNIFMENLPIDSDGNFEFEGGILIGPGTDSSKSWGGLDLGIVPIVMRGQVYTYNGTKQLIDVIDIDMQESLGQTIHVTFGASAVSSKTYADDLVVTINGESTTVANTNVVVGTLKNGNINFSLKNFQMTVNGTTSYIGNVAIDNIALDEDGNFSYNGIIRIGKGDLAGVTSWGGPDLGDVPVIIRGSLFDYANGNSTDGTSQCVIVLDIDMQESLGQTIHVTFGCDAISSRQYTDVLAVTVNGEQTTQETTVKVGFLGNGNINFTLDNFKLNANGLVTPIGNISIENLIVDESGHFEYEGNIRIGKGSDTSVSSWGGPDLGDVPVVLTGQMYQKDGTNYLLVAIDIDMEESLGQTINVTFGATALSTKTYTDDLAVTVNGETNTMQATVTVGTLKNGYINFTLKNFQMQLNGSTAYIGNVAVNALEVDENGKFSYTGNVRIGEGDLSGVLAWGGPELGAIPLVMRGQFYTYNKKEYLIVSIDINMEESIGQTIGVLFGGTPISVRSYTSTLAVTINSQVTYMPNTTVTVGTLRNGNINFTLKNFMLKQSNSEFESPIGNIAVNNLELDANGAFSYTGNIRIGNGDDENVTGWGGPDLGAVPVVLTGKSRADDVFVSIDIDMMSTMSQIIHVEFGEDFLKGDVNGDGSVTIADVTMLVNIVLGKAAVNAASDVNGDGSVTIADVTYLVNTVLGKN
ncbi:MAG: hypothetical protein IJ762_05485 [Bacteroidaceae bacterium]|nr:hypothetical protein [Bacteroidaceae bacterium]MBR1788623.1 hypothetical protein [Bacteroidaceae bacterium]